MSQVELVYHISAKPKKNKVFILVFGLKVIFLAQQNSMYHPFPICCCFSAYFSKNFNVNIIAIDHSKMQSWPTNYLLAASR
jgi:hypothetical protein